MIIMAKVLTMIMLKCNFQLMLGPSHYGRLTLGVARPHEYLYIE